MLSNTLRLNFCYLKIIHILHTLYHPKTMGHILKNGLVVRTIDSQSSGSVFKTAESLRGRSNEYQEILGTSAKK